MIVQSEAAGSNDCGAFFGPEYVRNVLVQDMTFLHYYSRGALGNPWQDMYVLQKPRNS